MDNDIPKAGGLFLIIYLFLSFAVGHPMTIIGGISWFIIGCGFFYLVGLFTLENINRKKPTQKRPIHRKVWVIFVKLGAVLIVYPLVYLLFDMLRAFRNSTNKFFKDLRRLY